MVFWRSSADMQRRAAFLASQTFVLLAMQVPKDNDKSAPSMAQFFAAIHGIYRNDPAVQEHISLEMVARKDSIVFYLFTPLHLREFIESQLYAQYPTLDIKPVADYSREVDLAGLHVATSRVKLTKEDVYPIKTYLDSEVDPLAGITAVMGNLSEREQLWFQIAVRPVGDEWQNKGVEHIKAVRSGTNKSKAVGLAKVGRVIGMIAQEVVRPGSVTGGAGSGNSEPPKLSAPEEAALKGIEGKITKLGYETIFRVVSIAPDETVARARTTALLGALKQYNTTNLNGFAAGDIKIDHYDSWAQYLNREFEEKGNILNIDELASVYHFPTTTVEVNALARSSAKKGEAPFNVPLKSQVEPQELTLIGKTDYRNKQEEFGIKLDDRKRHIYIIGKSGTGKSTLLENMIIDDLQEGRGVVVIDPHGELAEKVIESVPEHRVNDTVVIDPADVQWPISFNPLEKVEGYEERIASGFVSVLKKIFGNSWGPRLEYILRNATKALIEAPNSTMMGIPRMLTERGYRDFVLQHVTDPVVRNFWQYEWNAMEPKQQAEAIGPVLNKVGQFLSSSMIRNLTCQPKSTIDFRDVMDNKKILVVNLSKGRVGEDAMALLGSMIVTRVQLAAMSRADVAASERADCFLYVDEFQNFATDSFAEILSEARKYGLGLTIAHQYIAQLPEEVRDAVIGNVGTMILFRVGTPDGESLQKEFSPVFSVEDMINLPKAHIYTKLLVDGFAAQPFSAITLPPRHIEQSYRDAVIASSRAQYARPREEVENLIDEISGFRQRREQEEAAKKAAAILQGGGGSRQQMPAPMTEKSKPVFAPTQPLPAVQTAPVQSKPMVQPQAAKVPVASQPAAVPSAKLLFTGATLPQPVHKDATKLQNTSNPNTSTKPEKTGEERPRREKPPKIMNGWVYREVAQRGGQRWFLGEKEAVYWKRKSDEEAAGEPGSGLSLEVKKILSQSNQPSPQASKASESVSVKETCPATPKCSQSTPKSPQLRPPCSNPHSEQKPIAYQQVDSARQLEEGANQSMGLEIPLEVGKNVEL